MDHQWQQPYSEVTGRQGRYSHSTPQQQLQQPREMNNLSGLQHHPPSGVGYESYQTPTIPSHPQSMVASPAGTPRYSADGDVAMEDADPYNRMKYPSRPTHSHRASAQYIPHDDSAAARRYSPMKTVTPSSHHAASPLQSAQASHSQYMLQNSSARQSPTRSHQYSTPSQSYYSTPSESTESRCPSQIIES